MIDKQARRVLEDLVHKLGYVLADFYGGTVHAHYSTPVPREVSELKGQIACLGRMVEDLADALGYEFVCKEAEPAKIILQKKK